MELLYRGEKYADEFLTDYISRLAQHNGFTDDKGFRNHIRELYKQRPWAQVQGYSADKIDAWVVEGILRRNIKPDTIKSVRATRRGLWLDAPRICDACYEVDPYIRFYWRLVDYRFCHKHGSTMAAMKDEFEELSKRTEIAFKAVEFYEGSDLVQQQVILEFSFFEYEVELLRTLKVIFSGIPELLRRVCILVGDIRAGVLVGLSAQERVAYIVECLSCFSYRSKAVSRLLVLSIISNETAVHKQNKGYLFKDGGHNYKKYAVIEFGRDSVFENIYLQPDLDSIKNIENIDVSGILRDFEFNEILCRSVQQLIFLTRNCNDWCGLSIELPPVKKLSAVIS